MNVYQKIQAVMNDVQYLAKDDMVSFGNTKYKAISEEKVTTAMRQAIIKHGLVVFPVKQEWSRSGQITHVDVTYRIVNVDDPADYIETVSCGDGADTQDKGAGKAMTYAFKYMWLRTFALPTGEDPDKISSAELDAMAAENQERLARSRTVIMELLQGDMTGINKWIEANVKAGLMSETTTFDDLDAKQLGNLKRAILKSKGE